jgi:hypothetical protein
MPALRRIALAALVNAYVRPLDASVNERIGENPPSFKLLLIAHCTNLYCRKGK